LLLSMLERRSQTINGRDRHNHLAKVDAMKVNAENAVVNKISGNN
jgi:hypothetical protein